MERFLQYSLEHDKAIRLIFIDPSGALRQVNAVVERLEGDLVSLYIIRPPQRLTLPRGDILGASYTPKDDQ
jgi:hypothetical protein